MSVSKIATICEWSEWIDISNFTEICNLPGVYRVRLLDSTSNSPVPISRILGNDEDGILVIGESRDLKHRIKLFYKVIKDKTGFLRHSAGDRLFLNLLFRRASSQTFFDNKSFQVSYTKVQDKTGAQRLEELLLKIYFIEFGEFSMFWHYSLKIRILSFSYQLFS